MVFLTKLQKNLTNIRFLKINLLSWWLGHDRSTKAVFYRSTDSRSHRRRLGCDEGWVQVTPVGLDQWIHGGFFLPIPCSTRFHCGWLICSLLRLHRRGCLRSDSVCDRPVLDPSETLYDRLNTRGSCRMRISDVFLRRRRRWSEQLNHRRLRLRLVV